MQNSFSLAGITRLPVLEGEVSHVEIPRTNSSLGITIVGGADTPLVSKWYFMHKDGKIDNIYAQGTFYKQFSIKYNDVSMWKRQDLSYKIIQI